MAWIKTVEPEDATGELKAEYEKAIQRAGVADALGIDPEAEMHEAHEEWKQAQH